MMPSIPARLKGALAIVEGRFTVVVVPLYSFEDKGMAARRFHNK
jgi:hypothetical protein